MPLEALALELDGAQHLSDPVAYRRDRRKDQLLQENGYFVLRFLAEDVGKEAVIKGTRVTLRTVLASLAEGATIEEILKDFPPLTDVDVRAAIAFAAPSAQEDLPVGEAVVR